MTLRINSMTVATWVIFVVYIGLMCLIASFHEAWRDEAVLVNILRDSSSLGDFIHKTQNYGHPRLWHILLYVSHLLYPSYAVVKILNLTICAAAMFVFFRYSPFALWQKTLFSLGLFPLYIYPAFSRSYSLCMLLMFLLAVFYRDRWKYTLTVGVLLFLLANTHSHTLIITMAMLLMLTIEYGSNPHHRTGKNLFALILAMAGIILSIIQIIPDASSTLTSMKIQAADILRAFTISIVYPGKLFDKVFGYPSGLFSNIVLLVTGFYLFWRKKHLWTIFFLSIIGLGMFSVLFYPSSGLRHQGAVFLIWIFALWADAYEYSPQPREFWREPARHIQTHKNAYIGFLLILQICAGYPMIRKDLVYPYSSSKTLYTFLQQHQEFKDAVFVPEPDYLFEAAPYYQPDISIFLPRESVFRSYTQPTQANRMSLSLEELLQTGKRINQEKQKPVVFVIGHRIDKDGPYLVEQLNGKIFTFSQSSFDDFHRHTKHLASFHGSLSDENYELYLLNPEDHE